MFPSLGKPETTEIGCNAFLWMNHCSSDSGFVCRIVVDKWRVKKSKVCLVKTVRDHTMVYEVTRTFIQGKQYRYCYFFQQVYSIKPIKDAPQCITWVPSPEGSSPLGECLLFGDAQGYVNLLTVTSKDLNMKNAARDGRKYSASQYHVLDPEKLSQSVFEITMKLFYKDHARDQQNVVLIHRWSLYTGIIAWKTYTWRPVKCCLYKQVVFIYNGSLNQIWLYYTVFVRVTS